MADRLCLQGILYVLYIDIAWQLLLLKLGFGSGTDLLAPPGAVAGGRVFDQLHRIPLAGLNAAGELDWSRACVDGSHVRAKKGVPTPVCRRSVGARRAANTPDLRRARSPLKVITTAANVNDVTQPLALVDAIPPVAGRPAVPVGAPTPCSATIQSLCMTASRPLYVRCTGPGLRSTSLESLLPQKMPEG
ncbi:hypothetical protein [Streptomyces sp. x-80]|uniref:hypothetical protein n=1 Tax=Streptomyces sp. x-80 TaxID=2789282 RepID=UPI0039801AA5